MVHISNQPGNAESEPSRAGVKGYLDGLKDRLSETSSKTKKSLAAMRKDLSTNEIMVKKTLHRPKILCFNLYLQPFIRNLPDITEENRFFVKAELGNNQRQFNFLFSAIETKINILHQLKSAVKNIETLQKSFKSTEKEYLNSLNGKVFGMRSSPEKIAALQTRKDQLHSFYQNALRIVKLQDNIFFHNSPDYSSIFAMLFSYRVAVSQFLTAPREGFVESSQLRRVSIDRKMGQYRSSVASFLEELKSVKGVSDETHNNSEPIIVNGLTINTGNSLTEIACPLLSTEDLVSRSFSSLADPSPTAYMNNHEQKYAKIDCYSPESNAADTDLCIEDKGERRRVKKKVRFRVKKRITLPKENRETKSGYVSSSDDETEFEEAYMRINEEDDLIDASYIIKS